MNDLYKEQLDVLVKQNAEQAEQIDELKEALLYANGKFFGIINTPAGLRQDVITDAQKARTRIEQALAAQPQKGQGDE